MKFRDLVDRIIKQIEDKENEIYDQLEEMGVEKLKRHGDGGSILDVLGLSTGNPSI